MIQFKHHHFGGFVTDLGGVTSHTAIVARSLDIPAVVGLHNARQLISEDELLIVDGDAAACVIVNPDPVVLAEYRLRQARARARARRSCKRLKQDAGHDARRHAGRALRQHRAAATTCRRRSRPARRRRPVPHRVPVPQPQGAADEDEQFEAYRKVAQAMKGRPVTIRTFDLGADKALNGDGMTHEHAQPGAGPARDPLLPRRAADVPDPAARHPARLALRQRCGS